MRSTRYLWRFISPFGHETHIDAESHGGLQLSLLGNAVEVTNRAALEIVSGFELWWCVKFLFITTTAIKGRDVFTYEELTPNDCGSVGRIAQINSKQEVSGERALSMNGYNGAVEDAWSE